MIRIAAVADVHRGAEGRGQRHPELNRIDEHADVLLLAGDLTNYGTIEEARVVAGEFAGLAVPVVAVLGNHDYHSDRPKEVAYLLRDEGITVLEGESTVIATDGGQLGVAGVKLRRRLHRCAR